MIFVEVLRSAMFGLFRYSGRSDRLEQWTFSFLTAIAAFGVIVAVRNGVPLRGGFLLACLFAGGWFGLAHIALMVRRLHDHDRSGFFLMIPLFGLCLMTIGFLWQHGYTDYQVTIPRQYGQYVVWGGRAMCTISIGMLLSIFIGPGSTGENRYGDPV